MNAGCRIFDPDDSFVNVRQSPRGALIGPLMNAEKVIIVNIKKDAKSRIAFVMRKLVKC